MKNNYLMYGGDFMELVKNVSNHSMPSYWEKILNIAKSKEETYKQVCNEELLINLIDEYNLYGYIKEYTLKELLLLPDIVIIKFYCYLYNKTNLQGERIIGIAQKEKSYIWMFDRDYCFFNIRALGTEVYNTGNLINAAKLLITLRVSGLHLAPFFECKNGIVYCQNAYRIINQEIVNLEYLNLGVSAEEQMKFFIDCAHLLDMAVGFDFTPHVANMSKLILDYPELVRWIKLNKNHTRLFANKTIDEQYDEVYQESLHKEIKEIVDKVKTELNIKDIDSNDIDYKLSNKAQAIASKIIKDEGYYTVAVQTWNGICVPGFLRFNHVCEWPEWEYRDINGLDQSKHAIGLHSSLYIHKGMQANKLPKQVSKELHHNDVKRNEHVIKYIKEYLSDIVDLYSIDFIRMDYVDHIFDNVLYDEGQEVPINEMLTPNEILEIRRYLSNKVPGIGFQADKTSDVTEGYENAGFNVIVGTEARNNLDKRNIEETIKRCKNNFQDGEDMCKVLFSIDTQDVAHSLFLGKELSEREGSIGVLIRVFMSRFLNVGKNRRPKYEVIGNQDLSTGIHRANNVPESLIWKSDRYVFSNYHLLEDLYLELKSALDNCVIIDYEINEYYAAWILENTNLKKRWLCIIPVLFNTNPLEKNEIFYCNRMSSIKDVSIKYHTSNKNDSLSNITVNKVDENTMEVKIKYSAIALIEYIKNKKI